MASTNIQVFYLRQKNKDTKNFSVFFNDFFVFYYGGDLISNNWNDNILKNLCFFSRIFFFEFFFDLFIFPASRLFFFNRILFLYFLFFLFFFFSFVTWDGWFTKKRNNKKLYPIKNEENRTWDEVDNRL